MKASLVLLGFLLFACQAQSETLVVKAIEGKVVLKNKSGINRELKLSDSFEVEKGMSLETSKGSVTLVNPGDFGVKVYSGSELELSPPMKDQWELKLKHGSALSHVVNPKKIPNHFSLKTRVVTMGVRGTTFYVRDDGKKSIFFCPCKGKIDVKDSGSGREVKIFETTHHDEPTEFSAKKSKDTLVTRSAKDPMHSDQEIEVLLQSI